MPTIGRIGSAIVMVFRNDHPPPHFHVFGNGFSAKFVIEDLAILSVKGNMPSRLARAIAGWGQRHRAALYENWELARTGKPAKKIED